MAVEKNTNTRAAHSMALPITHACRCRPAAAQVALCLQASARAWSRTSKVLDLDALSTHDATATVFCRRALPLGGGV
ncbi:hypothetical protein OsJ_26524 [Oryza sativa Japonica Group]|nr:hypothetical protein OsJ_26524 [Oryza sativa Japonica Group]